MPPSYGAPILIAGSGLAGMTVALALAERNIPCTLLSRGAIGAEGSSVLAQGGIAAAMGRDDTPDLHATDTIAAGAGLCDPLIVKLVTDAAPDAIRWLAAQGVAFDRDEGGKLKLGLEGAHSRRRIVHARGDGTGAAITQALAARVREARSVTLMEGAEAIGLQSGADGIEGVFIRRGSASSAFVAAAHVVLATGGVGGLWAHTTNPLGSWGIGLALAARAGAVLRDLEFMQFHPTAIDAGRDPMPLASEALRGEGARLVNAQGEDLMEGLPQGALSPRDIVARALFAPLRAGGKVFLDARMIADFARRFPSIHGFCMAAGIDPVARLIPVRPAAHYHMGGVKVDAEGCSSVPGLWACGETASTGLHGANRLASNSLLEAVVMGRRLAREVGVGGWGSEAGEKGRMLAVDSSPEFGLSVRRIMAAHVGVLRDAAGLRQAVAALRPLAVESDMALAGLMIADAALRRTESRGAQARTDFPVPDAAWLRHQDSTMEEVMADGEKDDARSFA